MKRKWLIGLLGALGALMLCISGFTGTDPVEGELELQVAVSEATPAGQPPRLDMFSNDRGKALVPVTSAVTDKETGSSAADAPFQKIGPDHWIYSALKAVTAEAAPEIALESFKGDRPVTRFELAVVLAKVLEHMRGNHDSIQAPIEKVAVLEKLSREFGRELDMIGVRQTKLEARVGVLRKDVDGLKGQMKQSRLEIEKNRSSVKAVKDELLQGSQRVSALGQTVERCESRVETGEKKLQKALDVVSRLLVKVALAETKLNQMSAKGGVEVDRRRVASLARVVKQMDDRVRVNATRVAQAERPLSDPRVDSIKSLMEKLMNRVGNAESRLAAVDPELQKRKMEYLAGLVKKLKKRVENGEQEKVGRNEQALESVKSILKKFLVQFDSRLESVEKRVL